MKDKFNIGLESLFLWASILVAGLISYQVMPYYFLGDQFHYRDLYLNISDYPFPQAFDYYKSRIDSREPIYFSIVWFSSTIGLPKDSLILFSNVLLVWLAFKIFIRIGAHPFIAFFLICFTYYSFVLFFSAERLKFSLIFLLISFLLSKNKTIFAIISVLCHAQILIPVFSILAAGARNDVKLFFSNFRLNKKRFLFFLLIPFLSIFILFFLREHLQSKIESYFSANSIVELLKIFLFFMLSIVYAKDKYTTVYAFIPLFLAVYFVGGERVNFIGYFAFLFFALHYKKGFNLGVIVTSLYFSVQGFDFLRKIIIYGNGFHQI